MSSNSLPASSADKIIAEIREKREKERMIELEEERQEAEEEMRKL